MPFINVATAWKELATSRVGLNETQAVREETKQIISEEARSIPITEVGPCESKPKVQQEGHVSDAIRRARENFLNVVKSVSNGVQDINRTPSNNSSNTSTTVNTDPDASSVYATQRSSGSRKYHMTRYPGTVSGYDIGPSPRRRRLGKASRKLMTDRRGSGTNGMMGYGDGYPAGLSSLRNVISGSISALRSDWSSTMAAATCVPSVKADMVTLRIQNGRLEIHRLPDEEELGQGYRDMCCDDVQVSASGSGHAGSQQTITSEQLTVHYVMAAEGERTETEQPVALDEDAVMTTYRSDPESGNDPDVSLLDWQWAELGVNTVSTDTNTLLPCSVVVSQNADYLQQTDAADVIFDALITLINE